MNIQNQFFNNKEYTLVDVYELDNNKIYHFISDDEELFCVKNDHEKYITIENEEKINKIKEENGLIMPEILFFIKIPVASLKLLGQATNIKKVDSSTREKIIEDFKKTLENIEEGRREVNWEEKLKEVNYYTAEISSGMTQAFFHPATMGIYLDEKDLQDQSTDAKRTITHETIHALGRSFAFSFKMLGMMEGGTESIVDTIFGKKRSSFFADLDVNLSPQCTYKENVAIIRQMEAALGKKSVEEMLAIKRGFFKEFGQTYGKDLLRFLFHRSSRLAIGGFESKDVHSKYFEDTQNAILERVFNKDFESVSSFEDVEMYFQKLRKFELTRARKKENDYYEQYYNNKLNEAKELLLEQGVDSSKTEEILEKYKYQKQEFYPRRDREEIMLVIQKQSSYECTRSRISEIYKIEKENNQGLSSQESLQKIKGLWAEDPQNPGGGYIFALAYENNPLVVHTCDKHTVGTGSFVYGREEINQKSPDSPTISKNDEGNYTIKIPGSDEAIQLEEIKFHEKVNEKLAKEYDIYKSKINGQQVKHSSNNAQNKDSKSLLARILRLGIKRGVTLGEVKDNAKKVLSNEEPIKSPEEPSIEAEGK